MKVRIVTMLSLGAVVALSVPGVANASSDKTPRLAGCPSAESGWSLVDGEGWWERTLEGFEEAGVDPATVAAEFGMDLEGFEKFVIDDVLNAVDAPGNGDGSVCMRRAPANYPPYFLAAMDNRMGPPSR